MLLPLESRSPSEAVSAWILRWVSGSRRATSDLKCDTWWRNSLISSVSQLNKLRRSQGFR